jgi:acyl dehydratase
VPGAAPDGGGTPPPGDGGERIDAPADTGRRYAAASGDWNPHHLWPVTARLVGYRRPIAHGMWTLGRALATLEPALVPPWTADAAFKRPLYLPGRVLLRRWDDGPATAFEVRDAARGDLHLEGRVRPG